MIRSLCRRWADIAEDEPLWWNNYEDIVFVAYHSYWHAITAPKEDLHFLIARHRQPTFLHCLASQLGFRCVTHVRWRLRVSHHSGRNVCSPTDISHVVNILGHFIPKGLVIWDCHRHMFYHFVAGNVVLSMSLLDFTRYVQMPERDVMICFDSSTCNFSSMFRMRTHMLFPETMRYYSEVTFVSI